MTKLFLTVIFVIFSYTLFAEQKNDENSQKSIDLPSQTPAEKSPTSNSDSDIVINHAMIDKFNDAEFPDEMLSFLDVLTRYDFETALHLAKGYCSGELNSFESIKIDNYLTNNKAKTESDENRIILNSEQGY